MKTLRQHINEALKIGNNLSEWSVYSCQPKTKKELKEIIEERISKEGPNCDLNDIDTSLITDMSYLFANKLFNCNISEWNTSNVVNMIGMFYKSNFNGNISKWNVSKVRSMGDMFAKSKFNQDISKWKINKQCYTRYMFDGCPIKEEFKPILLR